MNDREIASLLRSPGPAATTKRWSCPDEQELAAYAENRLGRARFERLQGHVADCAFCRGQLAFLLRPEVAGPLPAVPPHLLEGATRRGGPGFGFLRPSFVLATAVLLVLTSLVVAPRQKESPAGSPGEGSDADTSLRSVLRLRPASAGVPVILRPREGQRLRPGISAFEWEPSPEALFYTVQIVAQKGDIVWEARSVEARLSLPASLVLESGRPYFAWILAHLRSGAVIRSPATRFRAGPD